MRVTDATAYESMRSSIMKARVEATKAQDTASTGLRVKKPSDDPYAAATARREESRRMLAEGAVRNTDVATSMLAGVDLAIQDVAEGLSEARSLALEGSTTGISDENRRAMAVRVRNIREQMVTSGNARVGGKYVFAGYRDDAPPFAQDGSFVGDELAPDIEVMPNLRLATSVNGREVFGEGSDSLFTAMDNLAAALETGDSDAIRNSIDVLDVNEDRVLTAVTKVGSMQNSVDTVRAVADRHATRAGNEVSRLTEADEFAAATDLIRTRTALEAAIAVAQQIPIGGLAGGR
jgi:flagellar hook-associated protein 3 FlgL